MLAPKDLNRHAQDVATVFQLVIQHSARQCRHQLSSRNYKCSTNSSGNSGSATVATAAWESNFNFLTMELLPKRHETSLNGPPVRTTWQQQQPRQQTARDLPLQTAGSHN
jgi:hypothetical protein